MKEKKKVIFEKYTKKEKLLIASLTSFAVSFVFLLFGPIDIYANNMKEFAFTFKDVFPLAFGAFAISFVLMTGVLFLFNRHLLNVLSALLVSLIFASYFDNIVLHAVTVVSGDATGGTIDDMINSLTVYVIFVFIFLAVALILTNKWKNIVVFLCVLLIGMNGASFATDFAKFDLFNDNSFETQNVMVTDGITEVSQQENIIYILFDRFDNRFVEQVREEEPEFFDDLEGFTYFDSATSMYTRTYPGVPYMISGVEYELQCSPTEYFDEAYQSSTFLKDLKDNGYDVNIYVDRYYEYEDASCFEGIANNIGTIDGYTPNKVGILKYLTKLSVARSFSYVLTRVMYMNANEGRTRALSTLNCDKEIYEDDDEKLYNLLTSQGMSCNSSEKNFTFLYTHGCHTPYILDENCKRSDEATAVSQVKGSFKMVKEYLDQLKALGVYDNSTIIISGDHGLPNEETEPLHEEVDAGITTAMFVKPRNAKNEKTITSHAQVSVANIIPTIVKDANINSTTDYGKGVFDIEESETTERTFYQSIYELSKHKLCFNKYKIVGDAHDISNWNLDKTIESNYQWY